MQRSALVQVEEVIQLVKKIGGSTVSARKPQLQLGWAVKEKRLRKAKARAKRQIANPRRTKPKAKVRMGILGAAYDGEPLWASAVNIVTSFPWSAIGLDSLTSNSLILSA